MLIGNSASAGVIYGFTVERSQQSFDVDFPSKDSPVPSYEANDFSDWATNSSCSSSILLLLGLCDLCQLVIDVGTGRFEFTFVVGFPNQLPKDLLKVPIT